MHQNSNRPGVHTEYSLQDQKKTILSLFFILIPFLIPSFPLIYSFPSLISCVPLSFHLCLSHSLSHSLFPCLICSVCFSLPHFLSHSLCLSLSFPLSFYHSLSHSSHVDLSVFTAPWFWSNSSEGHQNCFCYWQAESVWMISQHMFF